MQLVSQNITLKPLSLDSYKQSTKWLNDKEVAQYLGVEKDINEISRKQFIQQILNSDSEVNFMIINNSNNQYIGNVYLYNINNTQNTCELGIFIGEKEYWGRGYSSESIKLIKQYAKQILGIKTIIVNVIEYNTSALKCYINNGFEEYNKQGNTIQMSIQLFG